MTVTLLVSIIIAVLILLDWLLDFRAEVKKSARDDNGESHHKR